MEDPCWTKLPAALRDRVKAVDPPSDLYEIRLRAGGRMQLTGRDGSRLCGEEISRQQLMHIASALMEFSMYAWEDELARGYFTTRHGFRVGVAGRYRRVDGEIRLIDTHSLCIRLAKQVFGCADSVIPLIKGTSCLIISAPGCGKTTLLRDIARQLSQAGEDVSILDERSEIAAAWQGQPGMDVGPRSDVVEGLSKPTGIPMIVRALAPQVLITDELGSKADAAALQDAIRCGVRVVATAHAASLRDASRRSFLRPLLAEGFGCVIQLGYPPGRIEAAYRKENEKWTSVCIPGNCCSSP